MPLTKATTPTHHGADSNVGKPPTVLDHKMYPHIMDMIIAYASHASLLALRATCRTMMWRCDGVLVRHIVIYTNTTYNRKLPDDRLVTIATRFGERLPMFMNWCDHLEADLWGMSHSKYFDHHSLDPADWYEVHVPKVLYPGRVEEMYARNWFVRADRISKLLTANTKVVDVYGPIPFARFRELCRLKVMTNGLLSSNMDEDDVTYEPFRVGRLDTIVYFHNILYNDNMRTIMKAETLFMEEGQSLISCAPRKIVIHYTMDYDELPDDEMVDHWIPYNLYARGKVKDIVLIFQLLDPQAPKRNATVEAYHTNCLRHVLEWIASGVYFPKVRLTVVNAEDIFPQVLGLSDDATPAMVKECVTDRFWKEAKNNNRRGKKGFKRRFRSISLEQYAAEVGPERFALETVGYSEHYDQEVAPVDDETSDDGSSSEDDDSD